MLIIQLPIFSLYFSDVSLWKALCDVGCFVYLGYILRSFIKGTFVQQKQLLGQRHPETSSRHSHIEAHCQPFSKRTQLWDWGQLKTTHCLIPMAAMQVPVISSEISGSLPRHSQPVFCSEETEIHAYDPNLMVSLASSKPLSTAFKYASKLFYGMHNLANPQHPVQLPAPGAVPAQRYEALLSLPGPSHSSLQAQSRSKYRSP